MGGSGGNFIPRGRMEKRGQFDKPLESGRSILDGNLRKKQFDGRGRKEFGRKDEDLQ
jgi:hypothetical protein